PARRRASPRRKRREGGATIKEVAARAGLSVATISRVLNGKEDAVHPKTWGRAREAIDELRYIPHGGARSLSMNRTNTVGVLLPELHGEFFSEVIRGIDLAARAHSYHLLVSGSHNDWKEMSAVLAAMRGRVDGLIVMAPDLGSPVASDFPGSIPVVLMNCSTDINDSIVIDNYGGSVAMMRHLTALGHQRIAFVKGPDRNADAGERLRGYRNAMSHLGTTDRKHLEIAGDFSEEAGYTAGTAVLASSMKATAVFAANDSMAIGMLCALREAGINVPGQMAVVGFDGIPAGRYVYPSLTTVNVDIAELGRCAFDSVVNIIEAKKKTGFRRQILPTDLVIRESCGASRTAAGNRQQPQITSAASGGGH
ncbi:MAG: LacI family DNA-binding transcriptional regulator, partial [Acidobacteriota bacterium]